MGTSSAPDSRRRPHRTVQHPAAIQLGKPQKGFKRRSREFWLPGSMVNSGRHRKFFTRPLHVFLAELTSAGSKANSAKTQLAGCGSFQNQPEDGGMIEPKLEVPAELRDLAEKTIDQAEKAFGMFFDAAGKSMASIPNPGTEISRQALSFTEQNMKAAFDHARKLVHATDLQEAMRIQSEFLKSQFTNAGEHMRQISGEMMSAAKDASKGKS
jgi:phasin